MQEPDERSSVKQTVIKVAARDHLRITPSFGCVRKLIVEEPAVLEKRMLRVGVWPAPLPKPVIENRKRLGSCSVETLPAPLR